MALDGDGVGIFGDETLSELSDPLALLEGSALEDSNDDPEASDNTTFKDEDGEQPVEDDQPVTGNDS